MKQHFRISGPAMVSMALALFLVYACGARPAYAAQEVTILFTGETHASLYHCNCPIEPDGGVVRRATLIKRIRAQSPAVLLVDSGAYFAGGLMDEHTQNTELDTVRTRINLQALAMMGYDALAVGDDEFNFGREFFRRNVKAAGLPVAACNVRGEDGVLKPYIFKDAGGIKTALIGVTPPSVTQKVAGLTVEDPVAAVRRTVDEARRAGAIVIILLSHLGEAEDRKLIEDVPGIDVVLSGHSVLGPEARAVVGKTLLLRPSWQARRLGKAVLKVENGTVTGSSVELLRLSDEIADDPGVKGIMPRCFADADCKQGAQEGSCIAPGTPLARCSLIAARPVRLTILETRECFTCDPSATISALRSLFPGLKVVRVDVSDESAAALKRDFPIVGLPAFFLGKEAENEKGFETLKKDVTLVGGLYMVSQRAARPAFFTSRQKVPGKLDVVFSLFDPHAAATLDSVRELEPQVHFAGSETEAGFEAPNGRREIEENLRAVCVRKHAPERFLDYAACRAKAIDSSWWDGCLAGVDAAKIKACAQGDEGTALLRDNNKISEELSLKSYPAFLLDNQQAFGYRGAPTREKMEQIVKQRTGK